MSTSPKPGTIQDIKDKIRVAEICGDAPKAAALTQQLAGKK